MFITCPNETKIVTIVSTTPNYIKIITFESVGSNNLDCIKIDRRRLTTHLVQINCLILSLALGSRYTKKYSTSNNAVLLKLKVKYIELRPKTIIVSFCLIHNSFFSTQYTIHF